MDPSSLRTERAPISLDPLNGSVRTLQIPSMWDEPMIQLKKCNSQRLFICGGKGVGKSTFSRYAVNTLLNDYPIVAYIEADVGQPEFTPAGMVSLHLLSTPLLGPAHTHMKHPYRYEICYRTLKPSWC